MADWELASIDCLAAEGHQFYQSYSYNTFILTDLERYSNSDSALHFHDVNHKIFTFWVCLFRCTRRCGHPEGKINWMNNKKKRKEKKRRKNRSICGLIRNFILISCCPRLSFCPHPVCHGNLSPTRSTRNPHPFTLKETKSAINLCKLSVQYFTSLSFILIKRPQVQSILCGLDLLY